jgi:3-isopropylmalate dehydrogenase
VARIAFGLPAGRRRHLTSVSRASVLIISQLWRDAVSRLAAEFPQVALEPQLVAFFAIRLVQRPVDVDVVVTENLFSDILSNEAGVLAASLGMLSSASPGDGGAGLYESIHGSRVVRQPAVAGSGR